MFEILLRISSFFEVQKKKMRKKKKEEEINQIQSCLGGDGLAKWGL